MNFVVFFYLETRFMQMFFYNVCVIYFKFLFKYLLKPRVLRGCGRLPVSLHLLVETTFTKIVYSKGAR